MSWYTLIIKKPPIFKKHFKRLQDRCSDSPFDVTVLMKMVDRLTDELVKESWDNVCGLWSISCDDFVYICWCTVYDLEKAVVSRVPLCYAMYWSGKMRFWASLSTNFSKQACLWFALSIIFLLWQFSDVCFYLKP